MGLFRRVRRQPDVRGRGTAGVELGELVAGLAPGRGARIAILSDDGARDLADDVTARLREATVVDLSTSTDPWERHVRFVHDGPFDVVVDHTTDHAQRFVRMQELLFLLRAGGAMVIREGKASVESTGASFAAELDRVMAGQRGDARQPRKRRDPRWDPIRLGQAIASLDTRGGHLVLTRSTTPALAKLNEPAMNLHLTLEGGQDRLVSSLPAEQFRSRCDLVLNAAKRPSRQPEVYDVPEMSLRVYHDVLAAPGQVVAKDGLLFSDTYRHNSRGRLRNRHVLDLAPGFARLKFDETEFDTLPGTYFYLDSEHRGHFGHLLTEQVSRLWAWPEVKAAHPDAKVLVGSNRKRPQVVDYERAFYEAAGIAGDDIVLIDEPVRVERLYGATPMLSNPNYVHPGLGEIWRGVGDALAKDASGREWPSRIFLSRHEDAKRPCNNQAEVEELFRARGFAILLPETFSMPDQVQMFRSADVIAGFAGSGLFNIALVDSPKHVISVGSERYYAANEFQMASVLGHRMTQVTCAADDPDDFHSPFTFDHEREGAWLAEVLASLH